jgi:hypothetical protein
MRNWRRLGGTDPAAPATAGVGKVPRSVFPGPLSPRNGQHGHAADAPTGEALPAALGKVHPRWGFD